MASASATLDTLEVNATSHALLVSMAMVAMKFASARMEPTAARWMEAVPALLDGRAECK